MWIITSWLQTDLKALPNELGDFAVLGILLAADDEVNQAGSVPQNRGSVRLRDSHQARRVHLSFKDGKGCSLQGWHIKYHCLL